MPALPSTVAGETADDDVEDCDDPIHNRHDDTSDGIDYGHQASANCLEDAGDLRNMSVMRTIKVDDYALHKRRLHPWLRAAFC